jgi:hypothetical protein
VSLPSEEKAIARSMRATLWAIFTKMPTFSLITNDIYLLAVAVSATKDQYNEMPRCLIAPASLLFCCYSCPHRGNIVQYHPALTWGKF